jgi:hypothetical protein
MYQVFVSDNLYASRVGSPVPGRHSSSQIIDLSLGFDILPYRAPDTFCHLPCGSLLGDVAKTPAVRSPLLFASPVVFA